MRNGFNHLFGKFISKSKDGNLNLGSGSDIDPAFINLDWNTENGADFVWDLEQTPLPFKDGQFKLIVASHVLEHIKNYSELMDDLYRILADDGRIVIYVPYYTSQDAWASPEHVRVFNQDSWGYLNQRMYRNPGIGKYKTKIRCDFEVEQVVLLPMEKYRNHPDLLDLIRERWNIVQEMCAVLRKESNENVCEA